MHYAEFEPVPALAPYLERIWTLEGHADDLAGEPQVVLPDGRPELVLHLGDSFERIDSADDGTTIRTVQPKVLFAGQLTRQLVLHPTGRIGVVGLRFHPFGAAALFPQPQDALAGTTQAVEFLSAQVARALESVLATARDLAHGAALAQNAVVALVDDGRLDPRVVGAVGEIERSHGLVSIDRLAESCGMTRRHMERRFLRLVGMTPKRLSRIARFQRAVRTLQGTSDERAPGAVTAAACGYADQAHFIRDFRDLAGCPPGEHLLNKGILTGFFTR